MSPKEIVLQKTALMVLYIVQVFRGMAALEAFLSVTVLNSLESDVCFERL